jgi:hypothetical protein
MTMTRFPITLLTVAVTFILGSLFFLAGCSGDDPVTPAPLPEESSIAEVSDLDKALWQTVLEMPERRWMTDSAGENLGTTKLPFPGSPEQLMANFRTVYETRDPGEYIKLMHPDFLTILQDATIQEYPDVGTTLDRYEEQNIHKRMFSGLAVTDPQGELVPGVQDIHFSVFMPLNTWQVTPPDDIFPNALMAPFEVVIMLDRGQNYSTMRVEGLIKFYVTSSGFKHNGLKQQFYQMVGQVDLTNSGNKSVEGTSWGSVKAMFR